MPLARLPEGKADLGLEPVTVSLSISRR
jgi:hypothetical protein